MTWITRRWSTGGNGIGDDNNGGVQAPAKNMRYNHGGADNEEKEKEKEDTHHYTGLASTCGLTTIGSKREVLRYTPVMRVHYSHHRRRRGYCDVCRRALKSKRIQDGIVRLHGAVTRTKREILRKFRTTPEQMILNVLEHNNTALPVPAAEVAALFGDDARPEEIECILLPMITSGRIRIHRDAIWPAHTEVQARV